MKRLFRSRQNRMISGICGGMGEYLNIDPTVVRLIYVILTVFTGFWPGIVLYILAYFFIPEEED